MFRGGDGFSLAECGGSSFFLLDVLNSSKWLCVRGPPSGLPVFILSEVSFNHCYTPTWEGHGEEEVLLLPG